MKTNKKLLILACSVFGVLYLLVSIISLICSTEFFGLAHGGVMSWALAIGFELGAMACLVSTLILSKDKLGLVWFMFIILTLFQMMGNSYMAYTALKDYGGWVEMFGLNETEPVSQKRILAIISGAILPLVALGFIRIMVTAVSEYTAPKEVKEVPAQPTTPVEDKEEPATDKGETPKPADKPAEKKKEGAPVKEHKIDASLKQHNRAAGEFDI